MGNEETSSALGAQAVLGTPLSRPYWGTAHYGANPRVAYAGAAGLFATDGIAHSNITPAAGFGGTNEGNFTGGMFNGLSVFNDAVRVPCYWAGNLASIALPLPGWPAADRAKVMRPFKYFLVQCGGIINAVDAPFGIRWSVSAAPGAPP